MHYLRVKVFVACSNNSNNALANKHSHNQWHRLGTDWADTGHGLGTDWADTGHGLGRHWADRQ